LSVNYFLLLIITKNFEILIHALQAYTSTPKNVDIPARKEAGISACQMCSVNGLQHELSLLAELLFFFPCIREEQRRPVFVDSKGSYDLLCFFRHHEVCEGLASCHVDLGPLGWIDLDHMVDI